MGFGTKVRERVAKYLSKNETSIKSKEEERDELRSLSSSGIGDVATDYDVWGWYESKTSIEKNLTSRYIDYEDMDDYPDHSAALDTWADESTQPDQMKKVPIWVESTNHSVMERGNELLDHLKVDGDMWGLSRGIAKYGNQFGELLIGDNGVEGIRYLDAPTVRVVARAGKVIGYVQDPTGKFQINASQFEKCLESNTYLVGDMALFHPYEMVHWKLMLRRLRGLYGHGIGEPVRWLHKRMIMLEDSAVLFKITRAPVRLAYYVSCGDIPAEKRMAYVKQVKSMYARKPYKSSDGKMQFPYNPLNPMEEFWFPAGSGGGDTRIETVGGSDFQSMELLDYFQNKYHMALKVPRLHIGGNGEVSGSFLAQTSVIFARSILRQQGAICDGWDYVVGVDLMARNIDPESVSYATRMTIPSSIFELARMEVWNARADLMSRIGEYMPTTWMLLNIIGLSEEESAQIIALKQYERRVLSLWDARNLADGEKIQAGAGGDASSEEEEVSSALKAKWGQLLANEEKHSKFGLAEERRVLSKVNDLLSQDRKLASRMDDIATMVRDMKRITLMTRK
jgi:hypothetical protein